MKIDHVAVMVPDLFDHQDYEEFFELLGMTPVDLIDSPHEGQFSAKWWADSRGTSVHLVQPNIWHEPHPMNHFCVHVGAKRFGTCKASRFVERDNDTGRIWLTCGVRSAVRVEVQP